MELINLSKNTVISENISITKTMRDRIIGLLKEKEPKALSLKTRWGIHTFGMKFSIDCIVLDKNRKVVFIRENLLPNRVLFWNPKYCRVMELPSGAIGKSGTKIGDVLEIK